MPLDTSRGTFQDVIRASKTPLGAVATRLRETVFAIYPEAIEIAYPKENHAKYSLGLKASDVFGYICPMKDYVRLGFYFGGALPDPKRQLEGEGKRLRHIKVHSLAEANRPEIRRFIKAAVQERKKATG